MHASDASSPSRSFKRRFLRMLRLTALMSIATAVLAIVLVAKGSLDIRVPVLIATALGLGFCVLLGTALVTLLGLSNRMGQSESAAYRQQKDDNDSRS